MKKIALLFVSLLVLVAACKKEKNVSPECKNPRLKEKFDSCEVIISGILEKRLSNYTLYGRAPVTGDSSRAIAYGLKDLVDSSSTCFTTIMDYRAAVYAMSYGAGDISADVDSLEVVDLKNRCDLKWAEIEKYLEEQQ